MTQVAIPRPLLASRKSGWLQRLVSLPRQRRALARLDARLLKDVGITRAQAEAEAARPIWDAPDIWISGRC